MALSTTDNGQEMPSDSSNQTDHGVADHEVRQLESDNLNFLDSHMEDSVDQEIENNVFTENSVNHDLLQTDMARAALQAAYDFEMETSDEMMSMIEFVMGREWSWVDSVRVLRRIGRGIPNPLQLFAYDDRYDNILESAIREEVEYMGALSEDTLTQADQQYLSLEIREHMQLFFFNWDAALEVPPELNSQAGDHGRADMLEEAIRRCVRIRNQKEGTQGMVEVCTVCQDGLYQEVDEEDMRIATLECGHKYHLGCIKGWLRVRNLCPLCRAKVLHA